jgi:L-cystine uptake protein TcyP (sodium:dicarboxylate symporter family)
MWGWFASLPLIGKLWLIYLVAGGTLVMGVYWLDKRSSAKVNGAAGWLTFGAIMVIGAYGFPIMLLATLVLWLVQTFF